MVNQKVILLDSGNTRLKYRFQSRGGVFESLHEMNEFIFANEIKEVVYACVSSQENELLSVLIPLGVKVTKAQVQDHFLNLSLAYADVSTLGVDRWLSMVAALQNYKDCSLVVVNAGTALTIDCIDSEGIHHGGSISPGYNLSAKSLSNATAQLPEINQEKVIGLGHSTTSCINYGIVRSMTSLIEATSKEFDQSARIVVCGGDADFISDQMNLACQVEPELVLIGLFIYYRHIVENGVTA